jgi:hypothetical protein
VTADFATNQVNSVFTLLFGSYFGDWDVQNSFLRAPLASSPWALTCAWAGRPHWFMHHMGLGLPIGYSAKVTQNNSSGLYVSSWGAGEVHVGLMGDPTLRLQSVAPPSRLLSTANGGGGVALAWTTSSDASIEGYHVYRAPALGGPYDRLTDTLQAGTAYTDSSPLAGTNYYMVRAVKLQTSGSGTYYNPSQGTFGAYPDRRISLAVSNASTNDFPASGSFTYSAYDASVICSLSNAVIEANGVRRVATGWTGTGDIPSSGTTTATPLVDLTQNSSIAWLWQTNYWLDVASDANGTVDFSSGWYAAGSTLTLTAAPTAFRKTFSHWSGSAVPTGQETANPLTLTVAGTGAVTAVFDDTPNPDNQRLFMETFETYPNGLLLPGTNGWHAAEYEAVIATNDAAALGGVTAFGQAHGYPINTTHTKVGALQSEAALHVVSDAGKRMLMQTLLKPIPYDLDSIPDPATLTNQLAFLFSEAGHLVLLHGTPGTGTKVWSTFTGTTYDTNAWHLVKVETDYSTVGNGCRYFRVCVDGGHWLSHADGYTANDGSGASGGTWFALCDATATEMHSIGFVGTGWLDDILVGEVWSSLTGGGDLDHDGLWDFWECQNFGGTNMAAGAASADWDGDGFNNRAEFLAGTDPTSSNSVLVVIRGIVREAGGFRVSWQGGRDAVQYLERCDDLTTGLWNPIFTNPPPTDILNDLLDATAASNRFYRVRAVRE